MRAFALAVARALALALALALAVLTGCASAGRRARSDILAARAAYGSEPPATAQGWAVVEFARAQVGKRYCWGGAGPTCFDCSGLVTRAWGTAGVRLPHSSEAIASASAFPLDEVALDEVRAGDILWWPGHVAIYAGDGFAIEALDSRDGVVRRAARDPRRAFRPAGF